MVHVELNEKMAQDAYAAVRYVQENWDGVDNESYGVLSHSLGFRTAIELRNMPIAPNAYAAVGDIGQMGFGQYLDFPGNLLIAIGQYDEMISVEDALSAIQTATGNDSAEADVTYGSFENQTAYRLALAPTDHVFEAIDSTIVAESTEWLIQALQGESQLAHTLNPSSQIFFNKTIATFTGASFLLLSVVPVMLLVYSFIPEKQKPRKIPPDTVTFSGKKTFAISSILGAIMITIYTATSMGGFHLENIGLAWPNSMFAAGLLFFFMLSIVFLPTTMYVLMGKDSTKKAFASVGIYHSSLKEHIFDILKGFAIAGICIIWLMSCWHSVACLNPGNHGFSLLW
jgi:hypothetical protein